MRMSRMRTSQMDSRRTVVRMPHPRWCAYALPVVGDGGVWD